MRACIFCEKTGDISAEDAWPKWLNKLLHVAEGRPATTYLETTRGFLETIASQKEVMPRKTKTVCSGCNNGWMSQLETSVQPILTPLILDEKTGLSTADQALLAVWAIKTALTTQQTTPEERWFPPRTVYTTLRESHAPPTGYRVYAARVFGKGTNKGLPLRWDGTKSAHLSADSSDDEASDVFVSILMAGALIFQVIGDFRASKRGGLPPIMAAHFERIWPIRGPIFWPTCSFPSGLVPMMALSEPGLDESGQRVVWMPPARSGPPFELG